MGRRVNGPEHLQPCVSMILLCVVGLVEYEQGDLIERDEWTLIAIELRERTYEWMPILAFATCNVQLDDYQLCPGGPQFLSLACMNLP